MFEAETVDRIRSMVFDLVEFSPGALEVKVEPFPGVKVSYGDGRAVIGCNSLPTLARGFFLLAMECSGKNTSFHLEQKPSFASCGVMLDMSRNGVMRPQQVKQYLDHMAALGMNLLMLYTEDTYEIPEYPYFGYLRGRYTQRELMDIDEYAASLGIELVPCIQTLAHLTQFLQWPDGNGMRDNGDILLIDEPKTYEFIDRALAALRPCFRSNRIHIGMDEAHAVGRGVYQDKHGCVDRTDLLTRHLKRVTELCASYGFEPMMWSDMFFCLSNPKHIYRDLDYTLPAEKAAAIPDVSLIYWDYYSVKKENYDILLQKHLDLGRKTVFAGGIYTWTGFLPDLPMTLSTMCPALTSCCEKGIDTVFATLWGDGGCECNHFMALGMLSVFSEYCYRGPSCTQEEIARAGEFLTKMDFGALRMLSQFHQEDVEIGRRFLFGDILYDLTRTQIDFTAVEAIFQKALEEAKAYQAKGDRNEKWYQYAAQLYSILVTKVALRQNLQQRYKERDMAYLKEIAENCLPALKKDYEALNAIHKAQWLSTYKAFGFEVINARYGAIMARIDYAAEVLSDFVNGKTDCIEELEPEFLKPGGPGRFRNSITVSTIFD